MLWDLARMARDLESAISAGDEFAIGALTEKYATALDDAAELRGTPALILHELALELTTYHA